MTDPVLWAKLSWHELETLAQRPPHMVMWPIGAILGGLAGHARGAHPFD